MNEAFQVDNASLADVQQALADGRTNSTALTRAYLAASRPMTAPGRASTRCARSIRMRLPSPDCPTGRSRRSATRSPASRSSSRTTSRPPTASTPPPVPSPSVCAGQAGCDSRSRRLRAAGAVILGKANLTEFANFIAIDMPAGYSSLGGQVKNPYAPALDDKGVPIVPPGGSSSGSAVAVAAGLCAAAIGTETSGSLLSPATQNGLVTVKPTVGLISRAGIIPIAPSQDIAGPLTRTVRDAAILLNVLAARDPLDRRRGARSVRRTTPPSSTRTV